MENSRGQSDSPWEFPYRREPASPGLSEIRSYRRLRLVVLSALRRDFADRCCYCTGSTVEKGGEENFDVEHFRPKGRKEFAHLVFAYSNLYYACRGCNLAKGTKWPDASDEERWFIDPCEEAIYPEYLRITTTGEICEAPNSKLHYTDRSPSQRIEKFMRDVYTHSRNVFLITR